MRGPIGIVLVVALLAATVPVAAAGALPAAPTPWPAGDLPAAPAAGAAPPGMRTVIVTMKARADSGAVRGRDRAARQSALIGSLRSTASSSQAPLVPPARWPARAGVGSRATHRSGRSMAFRSRPPRPRSP